MILIIATGAVVLVVAVIVGIAEALGYDMS